MLAAILKLDIQRWIFWTNGQAGFQQLDIQGWVLLDWIFKGGYSVLDIRVGCQCWIASIRCQGCLFKVGYSALETRFSGLNIQVRNFPY
jgi:hypothetical protein